MILDDDIFSESSHLNGISIESSIFRVSLQFKSNLFYSLINLQKLVITNVIIRHFPDYLFDSLFKLKVLILTRNIYHTPLNSKLLKSLVNLDFLDMSRCNIEIFPSVV